MHALFAILFNVLHQPLQTGVGQLPALMARADAVQAAAPVDNASITAPWALAALAAPIVLGAYGAQPNSRDAARATGMLRLGPSTLTDQNLGAQRVVLECAAWCLLNRVLSTHRTTRALGLVYATWSRANAPSALVSTPLPDVGLNAHATWLTQQLAAISNSTELQQLQAARALWSQATARYSDARRGRRRYTRTVQGCGCTGRAVEIHSRGCV